MTRTAPPTRIARPHTGQPVHARRKSWKEPHFVLHENKLAPARQNRGEHGSPMMAHAIHGRCPPRWRPNAVLDRRARSCWPSRRAHDDHVEQATVSATTPTRRPSDVDPWRTDSSMRRKLHGPAAAAADHSELNAQLFSRFCEWSGSQTNSRRSAPRRRDGGQRTQIAA